MLFSSWSIEKRGLGVKGKRLKIEDIRRILTFYSADVIRVKIAVKHARMPLLDCTKSLY